MDLGVFLTQIVQNGSGGAAPQGGVNKKNPFALLNIGAGPNGETLSFRDLIGQKIKEAIEEHKETTEESVLIAPLEPQDHTALQSDAPILSQDPKLDFATLVSATPEIAAEMGQLENAVPMDPQAEIIATLALNQQAFDQTLKPLTQKVDNGLTIDNLRVTQESLDSGFIDTRQRILSILSEMSQTQPGTESFKSLLQSLTQALTGEGGFVPALPQTEAQQIQNILATIQSNAAGQPDKTPINAQLAAMEKAVASAPLPSQFEEILRDVTAWRPLPAAAPDAIVLTPPSKENPSTLSLHMTSEFRPPKNQSGRIEDDAAVQANVIQKQKIALHSLTPVPADKPLTARTMLSLQEQSALPLAAEAEATPEATGYEGLTKKASGPSPLENLQTKALANVKTVAAQTQTATNAVFPGTTAQNSPLAYTQHDDLWELSPITMTTLSGPAASTGLATHAPHASLPHPATQAVSSALHKMAQGGENKALEIQLDPPELGRLQIRMEFGKDKSIRAIIMSEKPETHLMLQRDSHVLERALQDAGLDADASSLEFTLADDGKGFSHNGGHDGHDPYFGTKHASASSLDTENGNDVEYGTMTWIVDHNTGHTHYNLVA